MLQTTLLPSYEVYMYHSSKQSYLSQKPLGFPVLHTKTLKHQTNRQNTRNRHFCIKPFLYTQYSSNASTLPQYHIRVYYRSIPGARNFPTSVPASMWLVFRLIHQKQAFVCSVSIQTFVHTHFWDMHNSSEHTEILNRELRGRKKKSCHAERKKTTIASTPQIWFLC